MESLFTIICEFRGGTYTKQIRANFPAEAFQLWAAMFKDEGFLPTQEIADFAEEVENSINEGNIVALESLQNVWYEGFSMGDDLLEVLIVSTNEAEVFAS